MEQSLGAVFKSALFFGGAFIFHGWRWSFRCFVRILHQHVGAKNARGEDGAGRLCSAVSGADGGEDDGACATKGTEEGLSVEGCKLAWVLVGWEDGRI